VMIVLISPRPMSRASIARIDSCDSRRRPWWSALEFACARSRARQWRCLTPQLAKIRSAKGSRPIRGGEHLVLGVGTGADRERKGADRAGAVARRGHAAAPRKSGCGTRGVSLRAGSCVRNGSQRTPHAPALLRFARAVGRGPFLRTFVVVASKPVAPLAHFEDCRRAPPSRRLRASSGAGRAVPRRRVARARARLTRRAQATRVAAVPVVRVAHAQQHDRRRGTTSSALW